MIYFDRETLSILRRIYRSKDRGITWGKLQEKYGSGTANIELLIALSKEQYIITKNELGDWVPCDSDWKHTNFRYRSYCTPKGNELIQQRCFNFWKWVVPTLISIAALIISALTLLSQFLWQQPIQ